MTFIKPSLIQHQEKWEKLEYEHCFLLMFQVRRARFTFLENQYSKS